MESGFSKAYTSLSMKFLNVGDHLYWFLNVSFVFNVVHASSVESCFGHRDKAMEEVRMCLKTLESVLKGKKFFGGDTIGLLDIQQDSGLDFLTADECPVLIKCCEEFVDCNVVKRHLPPTHKLIAFLKNWLSGNGWTD
ncbi:hypothetical protein V6Z11_D04G151000, partial [Gossypium hirsutum]|uniref:GST C-terminal domain-containing protein n=4 Tax=Gossypium TaxID=3633 RepID=A0A7J8SX83_GOSDV|nr:hypothetical protein [Gossypium davidsonii]PPD99448.1 hypothetical protein GOBAR_DD03524 [Gossypium barbadense]